LNILEWRVNGKQIALSGLSNDPDICSVDQKLAEVLKVRGFSVYLGALHPFVPACW